MVYLVSGNNNNVISINSNIVIVVSIGINFLNKFKKGGSVLVASHSPIHSP